jgi:HD-GYP domain-containing protein (c-di-GMP phosphodiesterase class II)
MTIDETAELIRKGSGRHFDPRIADAALALYARGKLAPKVVDVNGGDGGIGDTTEERG